MLSKHSPRTRVGLGAVALLAGSVLAAVPGAGANPAPGGASAASTTAVGQAAAPASKATQQRAVAAARAYLQAHPDLFQTAPADRFGSVRAISGTGGTWYVAFERTHRGLRVVGGDLVVAVDKTGKATGSTSALQRVVDLSSLTPRLPASQAVATSRARLDRVASTSRATLVIDAQSDRAAAPRLAWETVVKGRDAGLPSELTVLVDATSGRTLSTWDLVVAGTGTGYYNGAVSFGTSGSGTSWSMRDPARSGQRCGGQNGTTYTGTDNVWGNGSGTSLETACVDAMYAMNQEWDMLAAWFGRNGIKGDGTGYPARVGLADVNAYWNGSITNYGHSSDNARQLTSIDIVAHENGHGIFYTTPGGSSGDNETGGMNEATGDIFGALTEAYAANPNDPADYLVGEEANLVGQGPIRNMYNPAALGDPNCWSSAIKNTEVHAAAGPLNHWFYLLAKGSNSSPASPTCNGSTITGLGIQAAGRIFYNGLLLKTSGWTHARARVATLTAARNLYGTTDCTRFNTVKAAWAAISVPAQLGEPSCGSAPATCAEFTATGSVASRASVYRPSTSGFAAAAGQINGCLTGPTGVDLDLYLQRLSGGTWSTVASSEGTTSTETIAYAAAAGTYRWRIFAYSGSGSFTLRYDVP